MTVGMKRASGLSQCVYGNKAFLFFFPVMIQDLKMSTLLTCSCHTFFCPWTSVPLPDGPAEWLNAFLGLCFRTSYLTINTRVPLLPLQCFRIQACLLQVDTLYQCMWHKELLECRNRWCFATTLCDNGHHSHISIHYLYVYRRTRHGKSCEDSALYRELEATKESWEWERWSSPGNSTPIGCPMLKLSAWKTY